MNEPAGSRSPGRSPERVSIAILAMGGQGGGVLADWIVSLAESQGWAAQSTSVPGVAQRTGATIYYIEAALPKGDAQPVFALMPTPGDVDVVMAAELMEAGRSVLRGIVTPDRTTLIASTHRALAVVEKQTPGDGVADPAVVSIATEFAAKRVIAFDMEAMAKAKGSVVSATLFGALAAAGALPFPRAAFEDAIRAGGTGVEASLRAFGAAFDQTNTNPIEPIRRFPEKRFVGWPEKAGDAELDRIGERIRAFPAEAQPMIAAGARKLLDYLDPAYVTEYLDRLSPLADLDRAHGGEAKGFAFTTTAAKYIAAAMAYDDVPRVADLKIRASRQERVRREVGAAPDAIVTTTEYLPPPGRRVLRLPAKRLGRMDRGEAASCGCLEKRDRPRPENPYEHDHRLSDACDSRTARTPPTQYLALCARDRPSRGLAEGRRGGLQGALRARRRSARMPAARQGLFRYARTRAVEI